MNGIINARIGNLNIPALSTLSRRDISEGKWTIPLPAVLSQLIRKRGASGSQVSVAAAGSIWGTKDSKGRCWVDRVMQLSVIYYSSFLLVHKLTLSYILFHFKPFSGTLLYIVNPRNEIASEAVTLRDDHRRSNSAYPRAVQRLNSTDIPQFLLI